MEYQKKADLIQSTQPLTFKAQLERRRKDPPVYKTIFTEGSIQQTLTFNDVLLVPRYSEVNSRSQCNIQSWFSEKTPLNLPIVSSPMDTVTETEMAVEMARQGGLGIIHRFMPIEDQVNQIEKVKRAGVFINPTPVTVHDQDTFRIVNTLKIKYGISSFLVTKTQQAKEVQDSPRIAPKKTKKILQGILTNRDINCFKNQDEKVRDYMTPMDKLVYHQVGAEFQALNCDLNPILSACKQKLLANKIEKIPIITCKRQIMGLVSLKDIALFESQRTANKDSSGRLYVGAAVGANKDYIERARQLVDSGCDVLVIDVANGHSRLAMNATQQLKQIFPTTQIVSGSVATGEGAQNLIRSGANGIRCGIGNGSICITRVVAGSGVPQLSALMDTAPVCSYYDIPLCSDGGNKNSGNMCKALSAGASCIMLGRLIAGSEESPGVPFNKDGKFVKMYRGMAGLGANISKQQRNGGDKLNPQTFSSEGVEGYISFAGPLKFILQSFSNGIRSGMSYSGAFNLKELREKAKLVQISTSGFAQSNVHGIKKFD